jgi:hypothetical protein
MLIWTLLLVVYFVLIFMSGGFNYSFGNMPTP